MINWIYLGFQLLVRKNKQSENITFGPGNLWWKFFSIFLTFINYAIRLWIEKRIRGWFSNNRNSLVQPYYAVYTFMLNSCMRVTTMMNRHTIHSIVQTSTSTNLNCTWTLQHIGMRKHICATLEKSRIWSNDCQYLLLLWSFHVCNHVFTLLSAWL